MRAVIVDKVGTLGCVVLEGERVQQMWALRKQPEER